MSVDSSDVTFTDLTHDVDGKTMCLLCQEFSTSATVL